MRNWHIRCSYLYSVNEHFCHCSLFFIGSEHLRGQYQKPVFLITALGSTIVGKNRCSFSRAAAPRCDTPVPLYFAEPWWCHFKVNLRVSPGFPEVQHTEGTTLQAHVTALQCDIYIFGWSHRVSLLWKESAATQCKEPHYPVACTVMHQWWRVNNCNGLVATSSRRG